MGQKWLWLACGMTCVGAIAPVLALESGPVGKLGIDAYRLHQSPYNLIGRKIAIGQVEIGRPGKFGKDKAVAWNPALSLAGIFYRNTAAKSNENVDNHAMMVANVMVSQDKRFPGVAPGANLYSAAVGSLRQGGQPEECLTTQHVALQNSGDVRAINFSFGESLARDARENATLDGNALLTQCIDWSARVHKVLYTIAGNQGNGGIPIPTDQYNGITTAYTALRDGKFTKVDFANLSSMPVGSGSRLIKREINVGKRRAVSLLAPGNKINIYDLEGKVNEVSGTSFAAPHITASVALLQEYGDRQIKKSRSDWSLDSRRHEVMKAVMLNSADKIKDKGDGLHLGMTRTILSKNNRTWLESDAYKDPKIPLDIEMGTGQLNTFRAYQQLGAGQQNPTNSVANLGWDYRSVEANAYRDYVLEDSLKQDGFVSITLSWDRLVELKDTNGNKQFDVGESFRDRGLNNLDIYLMPVDATDTAQSICSSNSQDDSTEHIFCSVPKEGKYKIRVQYRHRVNQPIQPYAIAWWTVADR